MTVAEAAKILEVSPTLVYQLCRAGKLRCRRYGFGCLAIEAPPWVKRAG